MDITGSTNWLDTKTSTEQKLLLMNGIMYEPAKHVFFGRYLRFTMIMGCNGIVTINIWYQPIWQGKLGNQ